MADFQNVSCFVFEQSIMFYKSALQNVHKVYYFKTLSMCIFNAVKKQSGIGFIVHALLAIYIIYILCIATFWKSICVTHFNLNFTLSGDFYNSNVLIVLHDVYKFCSAKVRCTQCVNKKNYF